MTQHIDHLNRKTLAQAIERMTLDRIAAAIFDHDSKRYPYPSQWERLREQEQDAYRVLAREALAHIGRTKEQQT